MVSNLWRSKKEDNVTSKSFFRTLLCGAYAAMYWHPEENYGFVVMTNGCTGISDNDIFMNILCESVECMYKHFIN